MAREAAHSTLCPHLCQRRDHPLPAGPRLCDQVAAFLEGPLRQWSEVVAGGSAAPCGSEAIGDHGRALAGDPGGLLDHGDCAAAG